jgi:hypothetical protein
MLVRNLVHTAGKTECFSFTKTGWPAVFKEVITVYSENCIESISTFCRSAEVRFQVLMATSKKRMFLPRLRRVTVMEWYSTKHPIL